MRRKKLLFPSMLFLLCLSVPAHAADINAASCSQGLDRTLMYLW
jgi:hypothetical protein